MAGLHNAVLLLTEEYFATKCELPKIDVAECSDNSESAETLEIIVARQGSSEEDLCGAALAPIKAGGLYGSSRLDDSSDSIEAGELFYEFLGENLPKGMQPDFKSMPKPAFKVCEMKTNQISSYENKTIFLSQRLVLDALSENRQACFFLLLTMLAECGRFFSSNSNGNNGVDFASELIEYSDEKLLKENFKFADFIAPNAKGEEQRFTLEIFDLSYEQRKSIFCIWSLNV
jgi:hypothetical protein